MKLSKKQQKGFLCLNLNCHIIFWAMLLYGNYYTFGATSTWNGGGTTTNWSDANNWGGTAVAGGNALTFAGAARLTNFNDVSGLNLGAITLSTAKWNITGDPVTLTSSSFTYNVSGVSIWGLDSAINTQVSLVQNTAGSSLYLNGIISGSGGITKAAGGNGQGTLFLVNTNNSFAGPVNISGVLYYNSMAPGGQNSSLGAGNSTINLGAANTGYKATLVYVGTNSCQTDRAFLLQSLNTSVITFSNNSPNGSSLTFNGLINFYDTSNSAGIFFPTIFAGTSVGTNTFNSAINNYNTQIPIQSQWGGTLQIIGPGTWAFNSSININGALTVSGGAHFALGYQNIYDSDPLSSILTIASGSTMDVSAFDKGGAAFTLGANAGVPQSLTVGRAGSAQAVDLNGSLSLAGEAGATLNVSGIGTIGTLTISSNFIPASGSINFDLNNTNTTGSGSNDLILVNGNLDLSQGVSQINAQLLHGSLMTNAPYALFAYNGNLIGDASGLKVPAPSVAYLDGVVDVTSIPGLVLVTFQSSGLSAANLIWQGSANNNWDVNTSQNWLNGVTPSYFLNGNSVTFNDASSQTSISLVGSLIPTTITVSNNVNNYMLAGSGVIAGGSLLKQGTGLITLANANTFGGGTIISAGTVVATNAQALGTGNVTLGDANSGTKTITLEVDAATTNSINVSSNGTGGTTLASAGATTINSPIVLNKNMTIFCYNTNANSFTFQGGITGTGNVTVIGGIKLQNVTGSYTNPYNFTGNIYLMTNTNGNSSYLGFNQLAATANPNINVNLASNTVLGIVSSPPMNALIGGGSVIAGPGAKYGTTLNMGNGNGSGTFSGVVTTNSDGWTPNVTKNGTGTEIFTGDFTGATSGNPTNTGTTYVNAGTLAVNNPIGIGLNPFGVSVAANGILAGNGTIDQGTNGVALNGKLSIGNAGDTTGQSFTIVGTGTGGALQINAKGVLAVDLFSGAGGGDNTANTNAADFLNAQTQVIITNGWLSVSNANAMSGWAVGDKWKIANWGSTVTGVFTNLSLPTLPSDLAWDTSALYTTGVIGIVASPNPTAPAKILSISVAGGNFVITGTNLNGGASFHYVILTTTNLATPLTNWTVLSTNSFNADGSFSYTNTVSPTQPAAFFSAGAVK